MSFPKWMLNRRITNDSDLIVFTAQLHRALTIAVEALESAEKPKGRYSQDQLEHARNVIKDMATEAKEALRRIEAIGK